jgi:hypothetical protein
MLRDFGHHLDPIQILDDALGLIIARVRLARQQKLKRVVTTEQRGTRPPASRRSTSAPTAAWSPRGGGCAVRLLSPGRIVPRVLNADAQLTWSGGVDADELGQALAAPRRRLRA